MFLYVYQDTILLSYVKQMYVCVPNVFSWFCLCVPFSDVTNYYSIKNAFTLKSFKLIFKIDKNKIEKRWAPCLPWLASFTKKFYNWLEMILVTSLAFD